MKATVKIIAGFLVILGTNIYAAESAIVAYKDKDLELSSTSDQWVLKGIANLNSNKYGIKTRLTKATDEVLSLFDEKLDFVWHTESADKIKESFDEFLQIILEATQYLSYDAKTLRNGVIEVYTCLAQSYLNPFYNRYGFILWIIDREEFAKIACDFGKLMPQNKDLLALRKIAEFVEEHKRWGDRASVHRRLAYYNFSPEQYTDALIADLNSDIDPRMQVFFDKDALDLKQKISLLFQSPKISSDRLLAPRQSTGTIADNL